MIYCYHTYVWAEEPETGERALKRVVQTFLKEKDELVHIQAGGETITCTIEHPFYVQGKGWIAAQDLKPNDKLELRDCEDAFVDAVRYEKLDKPIPVFNFEVEGFHTYYVGAGCVLVHNTCTTDKVAKDLGYSKNSERSHGQPVYSNSNAKRALKYISPDIDAHNGGYWKAADSIKNLGSRNTRSGTYDITLSVRIGD